LAVVAPVTSHAKGYPFEVPLAVGRIRGVILSDHWKSLDWHQRHAQKIAKLPAAVMTQVLEKISALLQIP
jgi:mRNA interferase MazF